MKNRKEELYRLFEEGKIPTDPEIKALRYAANTVYKEYSIWKAGKSIGKATGKLETPLPGAKSEAKGKAKVNEKGDEIGKKVGVIEIAGENEGEGPPTIPELVKGGGIPIKAEVSVKTLAYFQIAASIAGDNLPLGDFIDTVTEDFFRGRGQSLGLVKLNPEKGKIDEERVREIVKEVFRQLTGKE